MLVCFPTNLLYIVVIPAECCVFLAVKVFFVLKTNLNSVTEKVQTYTSLTATLLKVNPKYLVDVDGKTQKALKLQK